MVLMPADLQSILQIEVPLIVQIASRPMALEEVMTLMPGSIIELPKLADEELEIMVNDRQVGVGRAVKVGENFGIRVSFIGDLKERIEAMGGEEEDGDSGQMDADDLAEQLLAGQ